jgi:hypothetical protein
LKNKEEITAIRVQIGDKKYPIIPISKYVLHIDLDYPFPEAWLQGWREERTRMLEYMGYTVNKIIIKKSPSKQGYHCWIHIRSLGELSDEQINFLHFLCGDCQTRVWVNILRVSRGLRKYWSKLFTRHLWKAPLPKRCQKCKLREVLNEMREQYGLGSANSHD